MLFVWSDITIQLASLQAWKLPFSLQKNQQNCTILSNLHFKCTRKQKKKKKITQKLRCNTCFRFRSLIWSL